METYLLSNWPLASSKKQQIKKKLARSLDDSLELKVP